MRDISGYEKIILALTALFLVVCGTVLLLDRPQTGYTVTVSGHRPEQSISLPSAQPDGTPDSLLPGEVIDLNTAPPLDLARLPGIGESRANAIAAYREANGPFQTVDELLLVDGIGEVTLEKLRPYAAAS